MGVAVNLLPCLRINGTEIRKPIELRRRQLLVDFPVTLQFDDAGDRRRFEHNYLCALPRRSW